ncbi:NACHT, LRR and PYD domains-containing protein 1b allele 3-like [Cottoperca gobio]|uniref:NACHT, LRR and PYD domains-containing protein 1b allele 3-like n=1 Tax=Cottoperca gobio TaxID=56716 RepID=A0A6J2RIG5_COTGO|nr:NACHT, LRR and PYD domains-containing protein 1b allele 3-like [Cottoperca gobio]
MLRNKGAISPLDSKHLTAFKQNTPPVSTESPEPYMLALLLHWPTESEDNCVFNLSQLIERMKNMYEKAHKKHLRSRYLRPLFFIGKGQDLDRIVHRKVLEGLILQGNEEAIQDWSREMIFKDPRVQEHLLKVHGETRNYRVYATIGGTSIEVDANLRNSLWRKCQVSFYLGFTIKGPVAFAIHTKTAEKGISRMDTSEFGACSGEMDSKDLTKLQPAVNRVDEVQTYSLQSQAGNYECSVSALRWVCKEEVSFKYKFSSWDEHMKRPICTDYMPAGPLMDITVTAGKMEEVHLPHWICVDQNSTVLDKFAVLHADTFDVLEKVPEVKSSHIKFLQPTFPRMGVLIRKELGLPFYYDVLIYKTNKEFLTLDVYLVPRDSALQQDVEQKQKSCGSILILKPGPDKSVQLGDHFSLTTDKTDANIQPSTRELRCDGRNYFEVFIRDADSDFTLRLQSEQNTVWTCTIHKGDYQSQTTDN